MDHTQSKVQRSKAAATIRIVCLLVIIVLMGQAVPRSVYGNAPSPDSAATARTPQGEAKPRFSISWTATATAHYEYTGGFGSSQVIDNQARMAGFGIWREEEGMPSNSYLEPFSMTYTEEYNNIQSGSCANGEPTYIHNHARIIDPQRYSSGPDHSPRISLMQRNDGTWYIPDPFIGAFYYCAGASCDRRDYTFERKYESVSCGKTIVDNTTYGEALPRFSSLPAPGNIESDGSNTSFHKHVESIQPGSSYSTTVVWDVAIRVLDGQDLTVEELEVTQGLQDIVNTIPLIQGRRTIVRAYLSTGAYTGSIPGVTGVLRAYSSGTLLGEVRPFNPEGIITAQPSPKWKQIDDTLNFELPYAWTLNDSLHFEVEVNPSRSLYETNYNNNIGRTDVSLSACNPLTIAYTPIHYDPPGGYKPSDPDADIAKGHEFLRKVYPVTDLGLKYVPWPVTTWSEIMHTGLITDTNQASSHLADRLAQDYLLGFANSDITSYPDRLVGWMPSGSGGPLNGEANDIPGVAAWVGENPGYWRATFAHEVGHTYGLYHNSLTTGARHWFDVYDRVIKPGAASLNGLDLYDFIHTPGLPEPERWVSPESYTHLMNQLCPASGAAASTTAAPIRAQATTSNTLMVTGIISTSPIGGSLGAIYQLPAGNTLIPPAGYKYCLKLKNGTTLLNQYCFNSDIEFEATTPLTPTRLSFGMIVPLPTGTNRIDLTKGTGGTVLASRVASAHPPTVTLQFPSAAGLTLTGPQTLQWTAGDPDGNPLAYGILYSADGGANWISLGSGIQNTTTYAVDFSDLPGGSQVLIKVLASDGFYSAEDVSDNTFTVANKPPTAAITSPSTGARFNTDGTVVLEGLGLDLEDGSIDDSALHWSSDIDGALGVGRLNEAILSQGVHTVTLTVQDSGGLTATDSITVAVLAPGEWMPYRVYLPIIKR